MTVFCPPFLNRPALRPATKSMALLALVFGTYPASRAADAPKTYLLDVSDLAASDVQARANKALRASIATVVDKPQPSPTGDPHDYVSYARYWWPDPNKPNGLPYVRKDGNHNLRQVNLGDEPRLGSMESNVKALALGWSVLHREDCARRAGEWLRAWFLTPATAMKPSLRYSQIRLGHDGNRGTSGGILDARGLAETVDAISLLSGSPALSPREDAAVRAWFSQYLNWLLNDPQALGEHRAPNNHGSWFLAQTITVARFSGNDAAARKLCEEDFARIGNQIRPDGSQPNELGREDALGYSLFNLQAQMIVVRLAKGLGIDLWHFQSPGGGSLAKAIAYLKPYNQAPQTWPGKQHRALSPGFLDGVLAQAEAFDHASL